MKNQLELEQELITQGTSGAPIVVVCEPTSKDAFSSGKVMRRAALEMFASNALKNGFTSDDFFFVSAAPPLTEDAKASEGRANKYLEQFTGKLRTILEAENPKLVIYLGKHAGRVLMGRPVKITEHRGQIHAGASITGGVPHLPLFSPNYVLQRPENRDIYESDFLLASKFRDTGYDFENFSKTIMDGDYRWVTDLEFLLDDPPKIMGVDTETRGYKWHDGLKILCAQISYAKHKAVCVPMDIAYWNDPKVMDESSEDLKRLNGRLHRRIHRQLRQLLGNPKVAVTGHNFKFDIHAFKNHDIEIANWHADTMQLAFVIDDNMQRKGLDDCARRWCPEMAGYADHFNATTDKSQMWNAKHADMMEYGCGDADVSRRLAFTMSKIAKKDALNYRCYEKIQMPALRMFAKMEREGLHVDTEALAELGKVAEEQEEELYDVLMGEIDGEVKRTHLEDPTNRKNATPKQILSFGRASFVNDWLFLHPKGMKLKPKVFTKATRHLPVEERIPSTSSKDHLPYFDHHLGVAYLMDYQKLSKMRGTYIGNPQKSLYEAVPLLKSGNKYGKKAQDIVDEMGLEPAYKPAKTTTPDLAGCVEIPTKKADVKLLLDGDGVLWWKTELAKTGFWQYLSKRNTVHPSYFLHRTNTGRTASSDPNGQNLPKRGKTERMAKLVKSYRNIFKPRPGELIIECDLSQAELRLIAWEAKDKKMLEIYRLGGDIHTSTAMAVMGLTEEHWNSLSKDEKAMFRFRAKAVNFGLCLSEGTEVLTDHGIIKIEDIKDWHLLWDGVEWVSHGGLKYMGVKKVITYDNIKATEDHQVWTYEGGKVSLGEASSKGYRLVKTGEGVRPVTYDDAERDHGSREKEGRTHLRSGGVFSVRDQEDGVFEQHPEGSNLKLPQVLEQEMQRAPEGGECPRGTIRRDGSAMQQNDSRIQPQLSGQGHSGEVPESGGVHQVGTGGVASIPIHDSGHRPGGQRRTLREGEPEVCDSEREPAEYTKVYDIVNAGPRRRFTANGKLVSNCFSMWWKGFITYAKTDYGIELTEKEGKETYDRYFALYAQLHDWHAEKKKLAHRDKEVRALHGALRRLPMIDSSEEGIVRAAERQAINATIQRFASDLGLIGMTRFGRDCPWDKFRPVAFVHDAVFVATSEEHAEEAMQSIRWYMQMPPLRKWFNLKSPIPLIADVSIGSTWGNMEERPDIEAIQPSWYNPDLD